MSLDAQLVPLTLPAGTEYPGLYQELINELCRYIAVGGLQDFAGINYGPTEPSEDNRDRPWFKTDESFNPIGWFSWNGLAWTPIPAVLPSGGTADRPVAPQEGTQYLDTDIDVALIYLNGAWVTLAGSPGDLKYVTAVSVAVALTANPGWSHFTAGIGRALVGAAADGSDDGTDAGQNEITLTEGQMPEHTHEDIILTGSEADSGDAGNFAIVAATQSVGQRTIVSSLTGPKGGSESFSILNQVRYQFCLVKD